MNRARWRGSVPDVAGRLEEELHGAAEAFEDGGELFHINGSRRSQRLR